MLAIEPIYTRKEDGTQEVTSPNLYLRINKEKESIYYQDGKFYKGLGEEPISYDEVSDWFWDIVRVNYLESERGREFIKKVGLVLPEKRVLTKKQKEVSVIKKAATLWTCDECGEVVPSLERGLHVGRHTLARKNKARKSNLGEKHDGTKIE